jgi:outer membrane protein assembly factor BamD (BamD/ComL family)
VLVLALLAAVGVTALVRFQLGATAPATAADESTLIERAQAALDRGDAAAARAILREHAERFPNGKLTTQRKLLDAYAERRERGEP